MSCGFWQELERAGDELFREGSSVRLRAERHFTECASCAESAYLLDPSWAVRRLAAGQFGAQETAEFKRRVLEGTRLRRIAHQVEPHGFDGHRRKAGMIAVGAAVLLAAVGGLALRWTAPQQSMAPDARLEPVDLFGSDAGPPAWQSLPRLGGLTPAEARVYELGQKEFALVMVVHETLDL